MFAVVVQCSQLVSVFIKWQLLSIFKILKWIQRIKVIRYSAVLFLKLCVLYTFCMELVRYVSVIVPFISGDVR